MPGDGYDIQPDAQVATPASAMPFSQTFGMPEEPERFMRRRKRPAMRLKVNVTSLIDVTFLLLVYFMIATSFTASEEVYRTDIPNREGVGQGDPFKLDQEPLRISVTSTGLGPDMYRLRLEGPYSQPATFDDLFDFLSSRQVRPDVTGGLFERDHPIIIQPARTARWEHAMEAFNAAARAHYTNVTFAKAG
jgi:biopolymer transport protein ExbD